jgi:hypothetical protein
VPKSVCIAVAAFVALACGGATAPTPASDSGTTIGNGAGTCPATFAETNGKACAPDGLQCTMAISCRNTPQQVRCACESAQFYCQDSIGPIALNGTPRCMGDDSGGDSDCPATMELGQGSACNRLGKSCYYVGALCSNGITKLNFCQCKPNGDGTMSYACAVVPCTPGQ